MKRTVMFGVLVVLSTCLVTVPAASQSRKVADDVWEFIPEKGGVEITKLLDQLTQVADIRVSYDPRSAQLKDRKVLLQGTFRMPRSEMLDWVRSVLFANRIVLVPLGPQDQNTFSVEDTNSPNVTRRPVPVAAEDLDAWKKKDGVYVISTFTLKNLRDTSRLRNALSQISTQRVGRVNDTPESRALVVADWAPTVYAMWETVKRVDAAAPKSRAGAMKVPGTQASQQLSRYEQSLVGSRTVLAAQYFLNRIQELNAAR